MNKLGFGILICFSLVACNKQAAVSKSENSNLTNIQVNGSPSILSEEISVANFLTEAENLKSEEWNKKYGIVSDLEISLAGKGNIEKLKNSWLKSEDDNRYRLATKEDFNYKTANFRSFVCPGICAAMVVDKSKSSPDNFGLLVLNETIKKGYSWVLKDKDLSNTQLSWASSTPYLGNVDENGKQIIDKKNFNSGCWIRWDSKLNKYVCSN